MLKRVLSVQSKSDKINDHNSEKAKDKEMRDYIKSVLLSQKLPVKEDNYGNIFVTKGNAKLYDCVVAHVDTVHAIETDYVIRTQDDFLYAFNRYNVEQVGIGGDDKVGVYIALQLLKDRNNIKAAFFRNEEVGKEGSEKFAKNHKSFFDDCKFVVQPDRKGNEDFITKSGGIEMCSSKFKKHAKKIYKNYGYKNVVGLTTDVDRLVKEGIGISCINLSCGYFRAHTDSEVVSMIDVERAYNLINELFNELKERYEYTYTPPVSSNAPFYGTGSRFDSGYSNYSPLGGKTSIIYKPDVSSESNEAMNKVDINHPDSFEKFEKVANSKFYKLKKHKVEIIHMKNHSCSDCGRKNTIFFLPTENEFYCIGCNDFVKNVNDVEVMRKGLILQDGTSMFFHNRIMNRWLKNEGTWRGADRGYTGY